MKFGQRWRMTFLCLVFVCPLLGLFAASLAATDAKKKPSASIVARFDKAKPEDYLDEGLCKDCHEYSHKSWQNSPHALFQADPKKPLGRGGCQSCHGPAAEHVSHLKPDAQPFEHIISFYRLTPEESAAVCMRCHNDTMIQRHWERTSHARAGVTCTACHQLHWPGPLGRERDKVVDEYDHSNPPIKRIKVDESVRNVVYTAAPDTKALLKGNEASLCGKCHRKEASEFRNNFHHPVPEGRMVCSDCHEIHPNRDQHKALHTTKMNCIRCHAENAGPFVFEHDPVHDLTGESCLECHRPHGSHNPRLLTNFSRGVCNQCHSDKANNHFPGRSCYQSGCHVAVHGSNHDRLLFTH